MPYLALTYISAHITNRHLNLFASFPVTFEFTGQNLISLKGENWFKCLYLFRQTKLCLHTPQHWVLRRFRDEFICASKLNFSNFPSTDERGVEEKVKDFGRMCVDALNFKMNAFAIYANIRTNQTQGKRTHERLHVCYRKIFLLLRSSLVWRCVEYGKSIGPLKCGWDLCVSFAKQFSLFWWMRCQLCVPRWAACRFIDTPLMSVSSWFECVIFCWLREKWWAAATSYLSSASRKRMCDAVTPCPTRSALNYFMAQLCRNSKVRSIQVWKGMPKRRAKAWHSRHWCWRCLTPSLFHTNSPLPRSLQLSSRIKCVCGTCQHFHFDFSDSSPLNFYDLLR